MYTNRILSILLTLVMVFSMTACSVSGTQSTTSETTTAATSTTTVEQSSEVSTTTEEYSLVGHPGIHDSLAMSPEEVSVALDELVQISESENLSSEEMCGLASRFRRILFSLPTDESSQDEFMIKSYEAFNNVYSQCITQNIDLQDLYSWVTLPVADILVKYFSSDNFAHPDELDYDFYLLNQDDSIKVATAVFNNPVFANNYWFAHSAIVSTDSELEDMGWNHLMKLSQNATPQVSEQLKEWADEMSKYDYFADNAEELLKVLES